ncbi:MAG: 16S rRNA (adenine(1518)-N(6)/adenine(1519)-N(6))-dimethyltransferase RsmA [Dermatophilaceae bacterium]
MAADPGEAASVALLGPTQVRELAAALGLRPTKRRGQNFVVDPNTVRRIVRLAGVRPTDTVVEVGPGLGSLTLALLGCAGHVTAIEIDSLLAAQLPRTVAARAPAVQGRLTTLQADALHVVRLPDPQPTAFVANLPYNVAVPVVLTFLARFPTIGRILVMVQLEVAERLAAAPGSAAYGAPSVKAAWWARARLVGRVPRSVFWPIPNVDSGLVALVRHAPPPSSASREEVFACVDAAFAQRRKTLRAALASWAGGPDAATQALRAAGVDPSARGERLDVATFAAIASRRPPRVGG